MDDTAMLNGRVHGLVTRSEPPRKQRRMSPGLFVGALALEILM